MKPLLRPFRILVALAMHTLCMAPAQTLPTPLYAPVTANPSTGVLRTPSNFFGANNAAISTALEGVDGPTFTGDTQPVIINGSISIRDTAAGGSVNIATTGGPTADYSLTLMPSSGIVATREWSVSQLQPLDSDLTSWATAADAGARRALIGAAGIDVSVYGASPSASASTNATAFSTALAAGGTIFISAPGNYAYNTTLVIKSKTTLILSPGVTLDYTGANYSALRNEGATSATGVVDSDITILGNGAVIKVSGSAASTQDTPGMNGHLNFFNVRRLRIDGLSCTTLGTARFFAQFCNVQMADITRLYVTGPGTIVKDAVKISGDCESIRIADCFFATTDDAISFCSWDYAALTPRVGPIRNILIERVEFADPSGAAAAGFIRFLPSRWLAWANGSSYLIADTVNNAGYQYRKTNAGTATGTVAPTHTTLGQKVTGADGIEWMCAGPGTFTEAPITNVTLRDLKISSANNHASLAKNDDGNGRSIYTGLSTSGLMSNLVFSRIVFNRPTAEVTPLALVGIAVDGLVAEDIVLESGKLPSSIFQLVGPAGNLVLRRIKAPVWRHSASTGLVQLSTGGSFTELLAEDCNITGATDGTNFNSTDGMLIYNTIASGLGRVIVRGGRYDWCPSLVRNLASAACNIDIQGVNFAKVRRLFVATAGTAANTIAVRGNRFEQAPTLGLWGSTVSTQTITGVVTGNIFDAASVVISDTGGASRVTFSDAPVVTASLAGAAAGDLVRTSSGWQEYNGSAWGAVRN